MFFLHLRHFQIGTETPSYTLAVYHILLVLFSFFFLGTISICVFYPVVQLAVLQEVTPVDFLFSDLFCCFLCAHPLQWPQGERPWLSYFPSCSSPNLSLSSKYQRLFKLWSALTPFWSESPSTPVAANCARSRLACPLSLVWFSQTSTAPRSLSSCLSNSRSPFDSSVPS